MGYPIDNNHLIHQFSVEKYIDFCSILKRKSSSGLSLQMFNNNNTCGLITQLCCDIYSDEIKSVILLLNDKKLGIAALDVPEAPCFTDKENAVLGAAVVTGVFNNIAVSNIDPINQMPFVVHTASHSNEQQIDSKGLEKFTPEMKLGFHNDGLLSETKVEIPHHIMVYNFFIGYHNPGNFIWIPTELWHEAERYQKLIENDNIIIKIKLSPNYHLNEKGDIVNTIPNYIEVPVSSANKQGEHRFFLNGQVLPEDNLKAHVDLILDIRESLEKNPIKIGIPQKERRAFIIKNTAGFHARNIFENPIEGIDLTRVYLRAVDVNAELYMVTE